MSETATKALQDARHELTTLHGLWASYAATDSGHHDPEEPVWLTNTTAAVNKIEQALARCERSLSERIEAAYDRVAATRADMLASRAALEDLEANAKAEHLDEWASAKNNDVRAAMLAGWLSDDEDYWENRRVYRGARDRYRLALLEIERLKLLVELAKAEGGVFS